MTSDVLVMVYAKAFDKVDHQHHTSKIEYYGIRDKTNKWIYSGLPSRPIPTGHFWLVNIQTVSMSNIDLSSRTISYRPSPSNCKLNKVSTVTLTSQISDRTVTNTVHYFDGDQAKEDRQIHHVYQAQ